MRKLSQSRKEEAPVFTADDHLWVQVQIEKRAHERWRAGGCREGMALSDCFQAEGEVLKQFILIFARRHLVPQASSPKCKTQLAEAPQRTNPDTKQSHNA
jgi:hypothetical protein